MGVTSMLVAHGTWAYGAMQLRAEDPALPAHAPPRPDRPSRAPRRYPFSAGVAELADALVVLGTPGADLGLKLTTKSKTSPRPSEGCLACW